MNDSLLFKIAASFVLALFTWPAIGQVSVLQGHNDHQRTGANTQETLLTPTSLGSGNFQRLFTLTLPTASNSVTAQPLYVPNIQIGGVAHNVLVIADARAEVYAYDADTGAQLWFVTLLDVAHGAGPDAPNNLSNNPCAANTQTIRYGIYGTPVIDPSTKTIYLVARSWEAGATVQRLHALDLTSGNEKLGGPIAIQATVSGTGWNSDGNGHLSFDPYSSFQRSGLLLQNGIVYMAFASFCEPYAPGWHGWLMSYNAATLQQISAWTTTPDATGSGIWMSGAGLAVDVTDPVNFPFGRMFVATGNGTFNAMAPYMTYRNFGDDIIRFDLTGGVITPQDSFTVSNQAQLNAEDGDLGSGGLVVLPDSAGSVQHPHLLVQAGKSGTIFLVDRDNMGGYNPTDNIVQELPSALGPIYSNPAYWNGNIYFYGYGDSLKAFSIANGLMSTTPTSMSTAVSSYPGATPSISSNGNMDAIVWTLATEGIEGVLQAYDATNVANQFWTSDTNFSRDDPGPRSKFSVATIANGKVFLGATSVYVYGSMFTVSAPSPVVQATAGGSGNVSLQVASPFGSGFSGNITLTTPDLPSGVSPTFSSPAVTLNAAPASGSSTLTLNVSSSVAAGTYLFHVVGSSGTLLSSAALNLIVTAAPAAQTPLITPLTGTYQSTQTVTITDSTPASTIYYTTNGTTPNTGSTVYNNGGFQVSSTTMVQAIAVSNGFSQSGTATSTITIQSPAATPSISPVTGTYSGSQTVTITDTTPGAVIYYTTNGTPPNTSSLVYGGSFPVPSSTTVIAIATAPGYGISNPASSAITIQSGTATPSITPPSGNYTSAQTVTITDSTAGATIYYTTNATTPTTSSTVYTTPFTVVNQTKIEAIAVSPGNPQSTVASVLISMPPTAPTPTFSLASGSYVLPQSVMISDTASGSTIYYTTNGAFPTTTSTQYTGPISVTTGETIKAMAIASPAYSQSPVATAVYTAVSPAAKPTMSPSTGTYTSPPVSVTITSSTPGATIYYTTDGSVPTTNSTQYTGPIPVSVTQTIGAIAVATGMSQSPLATAVYSIPPPTGTPVLSPGTGTYSPGPTVTITDSTPGAAIYYTTNGSIPTMGSIKYTGPVSVNTAETLQVVAFATGYQRSAIVSATYTLGATAAPSLSVGTGTYSPGPTVIISDSTPGSTIYYTTNGSTPTMGSIKYTGPITIIASGKLQAIAFAPGYSSSQLTSATYTLGPAATPILSPGPGSYSVGQMVTLKDATPGVTMYYTIDGSTPTSGSVKYTGPFTLNFSKTLNAIAVGSGYAQSATATGTYTIH